MRELLSVVFNMSMSLNHDATLRKAFLILESVLTVNKYIHRGKWGKADYLRNSM